MRQIRLPQEEWNKIFTGAFGVTMGSAAGAVTHYIAGAPMWCVILLTAFWTARCMTPLSNKD